MTNILFHSAQLNDRQLATIARALGSQPVSTPLQAHENHCRLTTEQALPADTLQDLRDELQMDVNVLPEGFRGDQVRLLITDMDSTLINIECVDEIADFIGVKPQVAEITEAAMRGELDFAASLTRRVALLEGLDDSALQHVYEERLRLNPGAEALLAGLKAAEVKTALVSGGFTFFTERLKSRLGLDYTLANVLEIQDGKLVGRVVGDIVGAEAKAAFLRQLCETLEIGAHQVVAMGDGANDLQMLSVAGLGVAYHAKPTVREQADVAIQYGGLDTVLDFIRN